ncbi:MAG: ABC transporter permease [Gammaproteobacteria bacterium]|nr:ABC transporter permease [Gammaproteobacteria bacterium]
MINFTTLIMNLKREFWENHRILITLPLIISALMILAAIGTVIYSNHSNAITDSDSASTISKNVTNEITSGVSTDPSVLDLNKKSNTDKNTQLESDVTASGNPSDEVTENNFWYIGIYFAFCWFIALFYLLNSLHSDRSDRSILFWKSMPVSDWESIFSKYLFASLAFAFFAMIIAWANSIVLYGLVASGINPDLVDPNAEEMAFDFAQMFVWPLIVIGITWLWSSIWFSWALFCSARAKRFPVLLFILVPTLYGFVEKLITGQNPLMSFVIAHSPWKLLSYISKEPRLGDFFQYLFIDNAGGLVASIIISTGLLYATTWHRANRIECE